MGYKLMALLREIDQHAVELYVVACVLLGTIFVLAVGCEIIVITAW